jgi:tRNA(fMet)-specific endonuclease VapC
MIYFLDTNICIYAVKGEFPGIRRQMQSLTPEMIRIPSMVKAELLVGARKSTNPQRALLVVEKFLSPYAIVPFCERAAVVYSVLRSELEKKGKTIGPYDLIIASTVLASRGTLITRNTREFSRISGLEFQDWTRT